MAIWNPWHGCRKISAGCENCYVYRTDARYGGDAAKVRKNKDFSLPMRRGAGGHYKLPPGELTFCCMTSDFFLEEADAWRADLWAMIRQRDDVPFFIITKRIHRFYESLPDDWGTGYENVTIGCTAENQERADFRLPIFLSAPIRHKVIICEPLLGHIDLSPYLTPEIEEVVAGGESGNTARECRFEWILSLREQCENAGVGFYFKQTGANFVKDHRRYKIPRKLQHAQARLADINIERKQTT